MSEKILRWTLGLTGIALGVFLLVTYISRLLG